MTQSQKMRIKATLAKLDKIFFEERETLTEAEEDKLRQAVTALEDMVLTQGN